MKIAAFSLLCFITFQLSAQDKYWIYLKEKDPSVSVSQLKSIFPDKVLSQKMEAGIDWFDYPVSASAKSLLNQSGVTIVNESRYLNAVSVFATEEQTNILSKLPFVKSVVPVVRLKETEPLNTEAVPMPLNKLNSVSSLDYGNSASQANLTKLSALHSLGITGKGISVGLIDEGTKWQDHEAFASLKIGEQKNFVTQPPGKPAPTFNHGTATLSLMAAYKPGTMIGGTFDSEFYLAETEYGPITDYAFEEDNLVAAIEWMESKGVDIVNVSLGYLDFLDKTSYSYANEDLDGKTALSTLAADIAAKKGMAMFVSAGNEGNSIGKTGSIAPPSDGFHVFASGAVSSSGTIASFSSRGPTNDGRIKPDGTSMGVSTMVALPASTKLPNGGYEFGNGTSYASPLSASAGALILSVYPELKSDELYDALRYTANNSQSPNKDIGWGLIDAEKALYSIGPAVSNQFDVSYSGSTVSLTGKLKFNQSFILGESNCVLRKSGSADSSVLSMTALTNDSVRFSGSFTASENDTIWFSFNLKTADSNIHTYPKNKNFGRLFLFGKPITESENLRRKNIGRTKYVTDTIDLKPISFSVSAPYPNPFNPSVNFKVTSPDHSPYSVKIYNVVGQLVDQFEGQFSIGDNFIHWNVSSGNSNSGSGLYFIQITSNRTSKILKAAFIK